MLNENLARIAEMCGGTLLNEKDGNIEINGVSTDTRSLQKGNLYLPLKGENFDGHDFLKQALEKGAAGFIWEKERELPSTDLPAVLVEESHEAMFQLATAYRNSIEGLKVIGLTGSNGKTTTKDVISALLKQQYKVEKTPANLNNEIGLSKTILDLDSDCEICVLEMGTDHMGDISLLTRIAQPDFALLLNVGDSHLETLGSKENIARAKLEILEGLKPNGFFLYNGDDIIMKRVLTEYVLPQNSYSFGTSEGNDHIIEPMKFDETGNTFSLNDHIYTIPLLGEHQMYNGSCAIILAEWFGLDYSDIAKGLTTISLTGMRNELIHLKNFSILDDSYKSNPQSLNSFLQTAYTLDQYPRKIAVIGDMLELGEDAVNIHENIGKNIDSERLDYLITYGDLAYYIYNNAKDFYPEDHVFHFSEKEEMMEKLKELIIPGTLVLVKASRALHLETVVEELRDYTLE